MLWLITLICLVAYVAGLLLLVRSMPGLVKHTFDEALFLAFAALAIGGAMLAFTAIGITSTVFTGALGMRILDALLVLVLGIITLRTSLKALRLPALSHHDALRPSRIMAGTFFLLLTVGAGAMLVLLFVPA